MRAPPFYLAAATLFWAWHANVFPLGIAMALALEAPRFLHTRWSFGSVDFARVGDLCTWAFVILGGYLTFTRGMPIPILEIFRWLPLVLLPLMTAQLFSEAGRVPLRAMFMSLRSARYAELGQQGVDISYTYVVVCALSAGAANLRQPSYFLGILLLAGWGWWAVRTTRYPRWVWMLVFSAVGIAGYAGQFGLSRLQQIVVDSTQSMFSGNARIDPYRSTTDIGEIGELKQSGRILVRVNAPESSQLPILLHTASYDTYAAPTWLGKTKFSLFDRDADVAHSTPAWLALGAGFASLAAQPGGTSWLISGSASSPSRISISQQVERGKAVLALPAGTFRIEGLAAQGLERNMLGTVEIQSREDLANFDAVFDPAATFGDKPQPADLKLPHNEVAVLDQIVGRLHAKGASPREAMAALRLYFQQEFRYSTYLSGGEQKTALANFLLVSHAGHCEYFATATTLLMRAAGVPARYATGFSVQEWSPLEERFIARERHAHAWAQVWDGGRWVDFDTTPPVWFAAEAGDESRLQKLADLWSWASYRYAVWENEQPAARTIVGLGLVVPLVAILIYRLLMQGPLAIRRAALKAAGEKQQLPGADSEFYEIEARLARAGCTRAADEPLAAWLARIARERNDIAVAPLQALLRLHYRYRFDPQGLNAEERAALGAQARRWLQAHVALAPGGV
jgi:protein-glutamine gamma-glutamyltransferase